MEVDRPDPQRLVERSEAPKPYAAGTWGPSASFSLLGDRTWHDLVE